MSESESEDEDVLPKAICGPAPSERSSVITLEDQDQLLAIEPDPHREKAFRIATELLTTEKSYVAVLHLIDQVIVHAVYLPRLTTVLEDFLSPLSHRCSERHILCASYDVPISNLWQA
jgi:hypothetical protein